MRRDAGDEKVARALFSLARGGAGGEAISACVMSTAHLTAWVRVRSGPFRVDAKKWKAVRPAIDIGSHL